MEEIKDGEFDNFFEHASENAQTEEQFHENRNVTRQKDKLKEAILATDIGKRILMFQQLKLGGVTIDSVVEEYMNYATIITDSAGNVTFNPEQLAPIYATEKRKASKDAGFDIPEEFTEAQIRITLNDTKLIELVNTSSVGFIPLQDVIKVIDEKNEFEMKTGISINNLSFAEMYEQISFNEEYKGIIIEQNILQMDKLYDSPDYAELLNNLSNEYNKTRNDWKIDYSDQQFEVTDGMQAAYVDGIQLLADENIEDLKEKEIDKDEFKKQIAGDENEFGEYIGDDPELLIIQTIYDKEKLRGELEALEECVELPLSELAESMQTVLRLSNKLGFGKRFEKCDNDQYKMVGEWKKIQNLIKRGRLKDNLTVNLLNYEKSLDNNNVPPLDKKEFAKMLYYFGNSSTPKQKEKVFELLKKANDINVFGEDNKKIDFIEINKDPEGNEYVFVNEVGKQKFISSFLSPKEIKELNNSFLLTKEEEAITRSNVSCKKHSSKRFLNLTKVISDQKMDFKNPEDVDAIMIAFALTHNDERNEKLNNKSYLSGKKVLKKSDGFEINDSAIDKSSRTGTILAFIHDHKEQFQKYIDSNGMIKVDELKELMQRQANAKDRNKKGFEIYTDFTVDDLEIQRLQKIESEKIARVKENLAKIKAISHEFDTQDKTKVRDSHDCLMETNQEELTSEIWEVLKNTSYDALNYDLITDLKELDGDKFSGIYGETKEFKPNDSFNKIGKSVFRNVGRFFEEIPHMITDPTKIAPNFTKVKNKLKRGAKRAFELFKNKYMTKKLPEGSKNPNIQNVNKNEEGIDNDSLEFINSGIKENIGINDQAYLVGSGEYSFEGYEVVNSVPFPVDVLKDATAYTVEDGITSAFELTYTPTPDGNAIDNKTGKKVKVVDVQDSKRSEKSTSMEHTEKQENSEMEITD